MQRYLFPRWTNKAPRRIVLFGLGPLVSFAVFGLYYWGTNDYLEVGYSPVQPVEFSHKLHAGDLGMDCRYCHSTVERSAFAAVPPTQTCMNCHSKIGLDRATLLPVRESWAFDKPIEWVRVHKLPEYVYFDHSAHLAAGVGCSSCHGRVDQMERVTQRESLSMGWCLECHRDPAPHVRAAADLTNMDWQPRPERSGQPATAPTGREVAPPVYCSGCHR